MVESPAITIMGTEERKSTLSTHFTSDFNQARKKIGLSGLNLFLHAHSVTYLSGIC